MDQFWETGDKCLSFDSPQRIPKGKDLGASRCGGSDQEPQNGSGRVRRRG